MIDTPDITDLQQSRLLTILTIFKRELNLENNLTGGFRSYF